MSTPPQPPTDEQLAAYIGPSWEKVYRRKFERFRQDPKGGFKPSWNWRAAFFPAWFLLHRLYLPFAALLACPLIGFLLVYAVTGGDAGSIIGLILIGLVGYVAFYPAVLLALLSLAVTQPSVSAVALAAAAVTLTVVQGVIADWLLYRQALVAAPAADPSAAPAVRRLRLSKPRSLSEDRVVFAAIGLINLFVFYLGSPGHGHTRQDSYNATMKADLRNLVTAEESYFADHRTYAASLTRLDYSTSAGDAIAITSASKKGFSATAMYNNSTRTCGIYVGAAPPPISGQSEGVPKCR